MGWRLDPPVKTRSYFTLLDVAILYFRGQSSAGREQESKWWAEEEDGNRGTEGGDSSGHAVTCGRAASMKPSVSSPRAATTEL